MENFTRALGLFNNYVTPRGWVILIEINHNIFMLSMFLIEW